jgi:hypothetical protein
LLRSDAFAGTADRPFERPGQPAKSTLEVGDRQIHPVHPRIEVDVQHIFFERRRISTDPEQQAPPRRLGDQRVKRAGAAQISMMKGRRIGAIQDGEYGFGPEPLRGPCLERRQSLLRVGGVPVQWPQQRRLEMIGASQPAAGPHRDAAWNATEAVALLRRVPHAMAYNYSLLDGDGVAASF